jgi:hypothetical protein
MFKENSEVLSLRLSETISFYSFNSNFYQFIRPLARVVYC